MIKRLLILLYLLTQGASLLWSQESDKDNQLRSLVGEYRQAIVTIPYPGVKAIDIITRNVSITSVKDKKVFISISPRTIDWFIKQKFDYLIPERPDYKGIVSAGSITRAMDWQSYPTYTQYVSIMQDFALTYPEICHLDTIGTSINGRLILALKISDNAGTDEDEPEVFYSSTMHGDETGGFILMLRLSDYLLKNYNIDTRVKNLVDNLEIWINPLANPDGTYTSGNTITSPVRENANGIDLNRNFPDPFQPLEIQEKENRDMINFMQNRKFVISANFHSGAEVVNYPWDRWLSKIHADDTWFNSISRAYVDTVHIYSGPSYMNYLDNGVTRGAVWYIIYGGRQDFVTWELQGREVTIELDDAFITPEAQLELLWQYNWRSLLGYLENAMYGIHGFVRDKDTSLPVPAKVYISGHDKDSSQVYSDTLTGKFIRLLSPGTWNVSFYAKGYQDTTIDDVIVISGQKTDLLVEMRSISSNIDTPVPETAVLYPNPASSMMKAILPEKVTGTVNIKIISQSGLKVADYDKDFAFGSPLEINITGLSAGGYTIIFTNTHSGVSYRSRFIVTGRSF
jgi:hypothetical protein